jgi:hypothetical protein
MKIYYKGIKLIKIKISDFLYKFFLQKVKRNVRDLLAAAKASPRLGLGTFLYDPLGLPFLPHRFVSLCTRGIAYLLITISSSSIDSPVIYARLACSLPYTLAIRLTRNLITNNFLCFFF